MSAKDDREYDNAWCVEYDAENVFVPDLEEVRGEWMKMHN
jgi:hypothetical protein